MDATPAQTGMQARKVLPVFGVLVVVIAGLGTVNTLLVHVAREHRYETGNELFRRAQSLTAEGRNAEALEAFRSAYNRDPQNVDFQLGFVRALRSTGRVREARNSLEDLLRKRPSEGAANTEMARLLAAEGNWRDAAWYYHRALYGQWRNTTDLRPLRFELADLLGANGAKQELLAELLLLGEPMANGTDAKHIGRLLLAAGDWPRAEELFRSELERASSDADLWAGLGQAQLGSGKYLAAERSFRRAGDSEEIRNDLALVSRVNALDPTLRRLGNTEKHRRTHQLATELLAALRGCAPQNPMVLTADAKLAEHAAARRPAEFAETDLDLVDQLWTARWEVCPPGAPIPKEASLLAAQISR
jgi:tetratricopeptide (TPR) repeat protein